ncbi:MFS transporter [Desmospora profundinema]|uniref:Sugar phosphate permease n=1 Tax=Desmospora profundinema TaxID=1571184 RepID=A0ABU1IPT5_9BACL|nr:MFS transporter [Desmospora profundinema]MDR6226731.1 sugar phosphate permease [Desmospora profundinema]
MKPLYIRAGFKRVRWFVFFLLIGSFMLGFFHRFAPGAFAEEISGEFGISASALGTLAAMHFYTYTAMQIPAGIWVDRWGTRFTVSVGAVIAAVGSLWFGLSPTFAWATVGPLLVGIGVSGIFVGMMKTNSLWFSPRHYGAVSGVTMLLGNAGAVMAAGPLAWLLLWFSWRNVLVAAGILSVLLALLTYMWVRDRPEQAGFSSSGQGW